MNLDEQSEFAHAYGKLYTENAALVGERDGARALLKDNRAEVARLTDALAERRTERNALRAELKDAERLRLQVEEFRVYAKNGWAKVEQLISKVEQVQRELKQEQEAYETLTALLKRRFPRNADSSLPDFAIEDVLRENERMRPVVEATLHNADELRRRLGIERLNRGLPVDAGENLLTTLAEKATLRAVDAYRAGDKP